MITPEMLRLYGLETPQKLAVHDTSHGANDLRMVYVLNLQIGKLVIKITRNAGTPERCPWVELIEHCYNT